MFSNVLNTNNIGHGNATESKFKVSAVVRGKPKYSNNRSCSRKSSISGDHNLVHASSCLVVYCSLFGFRGKEEMRVGRLKDGHSGPVNLRQQSFSSYFMVLKDSLAFVPMFLISW